MTIPAKAAELAERIDELKRKLAETESQQADLYRQLSLAIREYRSMTIDPDDIPDPTEVKATSPAQLAEKQRVLGKLAEDSEVKASAPSSRPPDSSH